MLGASAWAVLVARSETGTPDETGGIAIIIGVVVAAAVVFALIVWLFSVARRRWRTGREETHSYGDVGRIAGAAEAERRRTESEG